MYFMAKNLWILKKKAREREKKIGEGENKITKNLDF